MTFYLFQIVLLFVKKEYRNFVKKLLKMENKLVKSL
jgi:hypothetical protein